MPQTDSLEGLNEALKPVNGDTKIEDENDESMSYPCRYNVSSYGWDSDVEDLVKHIKKKRIFVPDFQRKFIWSSSEKSRFIESLILELPVPSVFLAHDSKNKRLNIVDGQQRLLSLRDYLDGKFYLTGKEIHEELRGCYFSRNVAKTKKSKVLSFRDARTLSEAVLHSIVIKPDPAYDGPQVRNQYDQSIIQLFKRLNTSGRPLQAQEIRTSIFYGRLDSLIRELNEDQAWRELFGIMHSRLKDMELILRFIALRENSTSYRSPMSKFLDNFMEAHREMPAKRAFAIGSAFKATVGFVRKTLGTNALRVGNSVRVSRFDAVMIGFDAYLQSHSSPSQLDIVERLKKLEHDDKYRSSVENFPNESDQVRARMDRIRTIFGA